GAGHAHLGDLGLLQHVTTESRTLLARDLGGTYDYLGPERFQAGPLDRVDPFKCDVYALGVMCWVLVSKDETGVNVDYQSRMRAATGLRMSLRSKYPIIHKDAQATAHVSVEKAVVVEVSAAATSLVVVVMVAGAVVVRVVVAAAAVVVIVVEVVVVVVCTATSSSLY
ncbi:hypothetical protein ElyMa_002021400, partial [Elysia marginata]